jgi:hypothetical protein
MTRSRECGPSSSGGASWRERRTFRPGTCLARSLSHRQRRQNASGGAGPHAATRAARRTNSKSAARFALCMAPSMRRGPPSWKLTSLSAAMIAVALTVFFVGTVLLFNRPAQTTGAGATDRNASPAESIWSDSQRATSASADPSAERTTLRARSDAGIEPGTVRRLETVRLGDMRQPVSGDRQDDVERDELARDEPRSTTSGGAAIRRLEAADSGATSPPGSVRQSAELPARGEKDAAVTPAAPELRAEVELEQCGVNVCPAGSVCCNESCGICTLPGQSCSKLSCSMPTFPVSVPCGRNTCSVGEVCCNWRCGICAAPGAACSQRTCD